MPTVSPPKNQKNAGYITILTVAKAARKRGIENAYQLYGRTNKLSYPRLLNLWSGKAKFTTCDLDILCDALKCRVSDLIKRIPKKIPADIKLKNGQ